MTKQLLYRAKVVSGLNEMGCKRVSECMAGGSNFRARVIGCGFHGALYR